MNSNLLFSASSDITVCSNAYISPEMNLIAQHEHIKDLGVFMSADCSFDHHISVISKKCSSIAGWRGNHNIMVLCSLMFVEAT